MNLTFMLDISCDDEFIDTPNKAKITLDDEELNFIKKVPAILKRMDASDMSKYIYPDGFYQGDQDEGEELVEDEEFRSECTKLKVYDHAIYIEGIVKHTSANWSCELTFTELNENIKVAKATPEQLPLLLNKLESESAKILLEERLKGNE